MGVPFDDSANLTGACDTPSCADGTWLARHRYPAVSVAVCFALGTAADHWLTLPWAHWLALCALFLLGWMSFSLRGRHAWAARLLLAGCACVGGARHHMVWSVAQTNDLSLYATNTPQPIRLTATIVTQPYTVPRRPISARADWTEDERTVCTVRCRRLACGDRRQSVSGLARLSVGGRLRGIEVGDVVTISGNLAAPRGPMNPGEFDFRAYLRRQGVRSLVRAGYPASVRTIGQEYLYTLSRWRGRFREKCETLFSKQMSRRTAPVARALLLGSRSAVSDEVRRSFAESGTMHLLAISGLHVGILAMLLYYTCRLLHLSLTNTTLVLLLGIAWYAFVTDVRPPVVRASALILITAAGIPWYRQAGAANTLGIAALVVLVWNPTDLFEPGAQLSFLAVIAILWSARWRLGDGGPGQRVSTAPEAADLAFSPFRQSARIARRRLFNAYVLTASIWLFTSPLVALHFHLVSPVGLVINVLLIPFVILALWLGYGLLLFGMLLPVLAWPFGVAFDGVLKLLLWFVDGAARFHLGHLYVPAPAMWWIVGVYVLLGALVCLPRNRLVTSVLGRALAVWLIVGLSVGLCRSGPSGLRSTFLAVGHGCAVLVETPTGKTLLYDAGTLSDGSRAREILVDAMWDRGISRIDALVISHADADHFNAVPGLLREIPVGSVLVARPFLDFRQSAVRELCDTAAARRVPIQLIWEGDRIALDEDVGIRVLHPALRFHASEDNDNSVVLSVRYAGRRLLLTADLAGEGLATLMRRPSERPDVLLSPHHGSLSANPPELAQWASPRWVVVSAGRKAPLETLRSTYGPQTQVVATCRSGAITFEIDPEGNIGCQSFLDTPH